MKRSFNLILIMLLGLVLLSCGSTGNDNDDLEIKISPSAQTVAVGEDVTYQVKVKNADDLFAIALEIAFNGAFVELPDNAMSVGSVWGNDVVSASFNELDRLNVAIGFMQGSNNEIDGDKTLFEFTITGKAVGESDLTIYNLTMLDADGEEVEDFEEIEIENSLVTVQ
jgi:Cohesin domain